MITKFGREALSLKQFMLRQDVLNLYRDILRTIKKIPSDTDRKELLSWARDDFKRHKHYQDEAVIKMMLAKGRMTLNELKNTIPAKN